MIKTELMTIRQDARDAIRRITAVPLAEGKGAKQAETTGEGLPALRKHAFLLASKFGLLNEALRITEEVVLEEAFKEKVYSFIRDSEPALCRSVTLGAFDEPAFMDALKIVEFFAKTFIAAQEQAQERRGQEGRGEVLSSIAASVALAEVDAAAKLPMAPLSAEEKFALCSDACWDRELLKALGEISSIPEIVEIGKILGHGGTVAMLRARSALRFVFERSEEDASILEGFGLG